MLLLTITTHDGPCNGVQREDVPAETACKFSAVASTAANVSPSVVVVVVVAVAVGNRASVVDLALAVAVLSSIAPWLNGILRLLGLSSSSSSSSSSSK